MWVVIDTLVLINDVPSIVNLLSKSVFKQPEVIIYKVQLLVFDIDIDFSNNNNMIL